MNPTAASANAATNTAPAATSLAIFAKGFKFGETKSTIDSMAVFDISAAKTSPNVKTKIAISVAEPCKNIAKEIKITAITICILAFRWVRMLYQIPAKA